MDSSSHDNNLKTNSKLDLPFWLATSIYKKCDYSTIETPKCYNNFMREILLADPTVVDLKKMNHYYYKFGLLISELIDADLGVGVAKMLLWSFQKRFIIIMDLSCQTDHRDLYKQINKLENTELDIYKAGQADAIGFLKWQRREFCRLQASSIISANKNKR